MRLALRLKSGVHELVETPLARYLRRRFRDPNIITYFDHENRNLVIATWFNREGGVVARPCPVIENNPEWAVHNMLWQRSSQALYDLKEARKNAWRHAVGDADEWQAEEQAHLEMVEWLRKQSSHWSDHPSWLLM